jgi:hypothetical protein
LAQPIIHSVITAGSFGGYVGVAGDCVGATGISERVPAGSGGFLQA